MQKYAELLCKLFGSGTTQLHGYPGHPEIELALLRLYERTDVTAYLELARYFLTERGNPTGCQGRHFYDVELERRGADVMKRPLPWPENRSLWYVDACGRMHQNANPSVQVPAGTSAHRRTAYHRRTFGACDVLTYGCCGLGSAGCQPIERHLTIEISDVPPVG